jgi:hypothetical protein
MRSPHEPDRPPSQPGQQLRPGTTYDARANDPSVVGDIEHVVRWQRVSRYLFPTGESHHQTLRSGIEDGRHQVVPGVQRAPDPCPVLLNQREQAVARDAVLGQFDLLGMRKQKALHGRDRDAADLRHL